MFLDVADQVVNEVVDYNTVGSVDFVNIFLYFKNATQIVDAHVIIRNWHHNNRITQKKGDQHKVS